MWPQTDFPTMSMHYALSLGSVLAALTLCSASASAQFDDSSHAPSQAALLDTSQSARWMRTAYGTDLVDGRVVAGGPDFKAHFDHGRMRFTPAFGVHAPRNYPLTFAFDRAVRGDALLSQSSGTAQAQRAGNRVEFERPGGIVERYDVTRDGLELSFLVPTRPAGNGDLLVRGRLETELTLAGSTAQGGLRFELPGVGGVEIGGVTAIDARGSQIAGALRSTDGYLELVVPGAFLDQAHFPLVIDPLIGTYFEIDGNAWEDGDPDVATTSAADARYLVVWERRFSLSDTDLRGYRLDATGDYIGNFLLLENGDELSNSPAIGHVRVSQRFFVAWAETPGIFSPFNIVGRAVDGLATGSTSAKITLAASALLQSDPDVGGERTLADDDVYVVWSESGVGIRGCQVSLPTTGAAPAVFGVQQISDPVAAGENTKPSISKSAGETGVFGLAYHSGTTDVSYRTMTRNGVLTGAQLLLVSLSGTHREPSIDGDGTNFLLVFERGEGFVIGNFTDIWGASLTFNGTFLSPFAFAPIENDIFDYESNPDVVYTGGQFLVSYVDQEPNNDDAYVKLVDPFSCLACDAESLISYSSGFDQDIRSAAHYSAGLNSNQALLVWEKFAGDGDILAHLFESPDGTADFAGGCGQGGVASTPCAFAGNENFQLHLGEAAALRPAFLMISFALSPTACGPCTLWVNPGGALVYFAGVTDTQGRLSFSAGIPPGTEGVPFVSQWALTSGTACAQFGVDLSNGLQTTIE